MAHSPSNHGKPYIRGAKILWVCTVREILTSINLFKATSNLTALLCKFTKKDEALNLDSIAYGLGNFFIVLSGVTVKLFYKLDGPIPANFCNSPFWNIRNLNDAVSEKKRMVIDSSYVISVHD